MGVSSGVWSRREAHLHGTLETLILLTSPTSDNLKEEYERMKRKLYGIYQSEIPAVVVVKLFRKHAVGPVDKERKKKKDLLCAFPFNATCTHARVYRLPAGNVDT